MSGGDWLNQEQEVEQMAHYKEIPECPDCQVCPEWIEGFLDGPLQVAREHLPWVDIVLLISLFFGVLVIAIVLPPSHRFIKRLCKLFNTAWKATSDKK